MQLVPERLTLIERRGRRRELPTDLSPGAAPLAQPAGDDESTLGDDTIREVARLFTVFGLPERLAE